MVTNMLSVPLSEGVAENMGDGMYIVRQEVDGEPQAVNLTVADMWKMLQNALGGLMEAQWPSGLPKESEERIASPDPLSGQMGGHSFRRAA
ncbi:hypothetical protein [Tardibacter chloracetimidivorans]|nr:hypothetical protein [Tardibacter chloracetimidivorans]